MSKPRVLVTGASGFTGHYVCKELKKEGFEVFSLTQDGSLKGRSVDLCSYNDVLKCIEHVKPESVIHLAAIAFVGHEAPNDFYRVNVEGTLNLLRALEEVESIHGSVVLASSANVYGNAYLNMPISEDFRPYPVNDYAVSKLSMEYVARLHKDRLPIAIVRPFNYTGCGQDLNFLVPKIVSAFKKRQPILELGNLNISRDFSDVRDIARYYVQMVIKRISGKTLNFCSGRSVSLKYLIEVCENITGHSVEIRSQCALKRKNELKNLLGNPSMLFHVAGLGCQYSIEDTLKWMLEEKN